MGSTAHDGGAPSDVDEQQQEAHTHMHSRLRGSFALGTSQHRAKLAGMHQSAASPSTGAALDSQYVCSAGQREFKTVPQLHEHGFLTRSGP